MPVYLGNEPKTLTASALALVLCSERFLEVATDKRAAERFASVKEFRSYLAIPDASRP